MHRIVIVAIFASILTLGPLGASGEECGVGNRVVTDRSNLIRKAAAFTIDFFTFKGISTTFEVAGCTEENNIFKRSASARMRHHAGYNLDHLAADMARGKGEYLDALAHLMEIEDRDRTAFRALTRENFSTLFTRDNADADDILATLLGLMSEHETLSVYVSS
jgi:hypothetical protein